MLVVFSGGQDSTTCLYWAKSRADRVVAISLDYGQRHKSELSAAKKVASLAGVVHEVVDIKGVLKSASPLTSDSAKPKEYGGYSEIKRTNKKQVENTFVPMRNSLFITIAANRALHYGFKDIVVGVSQMDDAGYPDCTYQFIKKQEEAINESLGISDFKIHAPLLNSSKADTVRMAINLEGCMSAMAHTVTCYNGRVPPCGKCHSCVLRAHGFSQAGVKDPIMR